MSDEEPASELVKKYANKVWPIGAQISPSGSYLYLVRLNPDECPAAYKVGTSKHPPGRLNAIHNIAPRASLIWVSSGGRCDEQALLEHLKTHKPTHDEDDPIEYVGGEVFKLPNSESDCQVWGDGGSSCDAYMVMIVESYL